MSFAFMALYTGDYLRDTRHLSPMKHGIYLLLLMHCWDQKGPVPLDEQEAAGIANCRSADEIECLRYVINRYFVRMDDGHYNKRMTDEIAKSETISGHRRAGALEKARRQRDALRSAQAVLKQSTSIASAGTPTPTPTPTTTHTLKASAAETPPGFLKFWNAYPNRSGRRKDKKKCVQLWGRNGLEAKADEIVVHVEAMKETVWKPNAKGESFEPGADVYLRNERWEDGLPNDGRPKKLDVVL